MCYDAGYCTKKNKKVAWREQMTLLSILRSCNLFSVLLTRQGPTADNLSAETKQILEEITRYLNLEKLLPCYRHTVTVRCVILMMSLFLRNWWRKWLNLCNICMEECIVSSYLDVSHSLFSFNNCSKVI